MNDKFRLVVLSALMLFVELALIRWTGSNILHLSYFSNFILLGSFLGIGIGFLRANKPRDAFRLAPLTLALLIGFVLIFPVSVARKGSDVIYFTTVETTGLPAWITLPVIFLVVACVLAMIAEGVAKTFIKFPALEAYRLDIAGSITGIVLFSILSFLHAPPVVWGLIAAAAFVALYLPNLKILQIVPLVAIVAGLGVESVAAGTSWSPYYKVTTNEYEVDGEKVVKVSVNGIPHQNIASIKVREKYEPLYFKPYERLNNNSLDDVLIVGAGNGSDVAIALSKGAKHVDAVEIDPRLQQLGKELHPNRPYDDPRVDVHINDGRAFLERTDKKYDLILFSLPDSLTLVSGQSSLRLESYLFTQEAMETASAHLKDNGAFGMYNYYRESWLIDRLAKTSEVANGRTPCVDRVEGTGGLALILNSPNAQAVNCEQPWTPVSSVTPKPATDDHPFLYLRDRGLPNIYLTAIVMILLASLLLIRVNAGPLRNMRSYADLFFMGVAFLLLETKNVVQFALLFGTTWFVNALVFMGVLLVVYLAIEVARRVTIANPGVLYVPLLISLAVAWLVPQHALLGLDLVPRFITAVVLAFTPIFLANLVFAERFKGTAATTVAFGANLLGAMVGGLVEYLALITGYRALLVVTALLYGLAFLAGRKSFVAEKDSVST